MTRMTALLLTLVATSAFAAPAWHHPLYLGNGGIWNQRIAIDVRNDGAAEVKGDSVSVPIGKGDGEAHPSSDTGCCSSHGSPLICRLGRRDRCSHWDGPAPRPWGETPGPMAGGTTFSFTGDGRGAEPAPCGALRYTQSSVKPPFNSAFSGVTES